MSSNKYSPASKTEKFNSPSSNKNFQTISPMSKPPMFSARQFGYTVPNKTINFNDPYKEPSRDPETIRGTKEFVSVNRRDPNNLEKRILSLMNDYRSQNNLPSLNFSRHLSDIVSSHIQKAANGSIPLSNSGIKNRVRQVDGITSYAENIGTCCALTKNSSSENSDFDPAKKIVDSWIKSPPYRSNILGRFNKVGISIVKGKNQWYASAFFALIY